MFQSSPMNWFLYFNIIIISMIMLMKNLNLKKNLFKNLFKNYIYKKN